MEPPCRPAPERRGRDADLADLIARRQGCGTGDPFPGVAAAVVSHLAGHTVHEFLEALLARNFRLAGALFAGEAPDAPGPPDAVPGGAPGTTPDTTANTTADTGATP